MEIEKILHDLVQKTYLAGMMHGEGLLGSDEHKKMFDEGQALYAELKAFLTPRVPDACPYCAGKGEFVNVIGKALRCNHCAGTGQRR